MCQFHFFIGKITFQKLDYFVQQRNSTFVKSYLDGSIIRGRKAFVKCFGIISFKMNPINTPGIFQGTPVLVSRVFRNDKTRIGSQRYRFSVDFYPAFTSQTVQEYVLVDAVLSSTCCGVWHSENSQWHPEKGCEKKRLETNFLFLSGSQNNHGLSQENRP